MINKLVGPRKKKRDLAKTQRLYPENISAKQAAVAFVGGLEEFSRKRLKKMIDSGIDAGSSIAKQYDIPLDEFMREVNRLI